MDIEDKQDGKVGFLDGAKSFFSGIVDNVKDRATKFAKFTKEHPFIAVGCIALAGLSGVCIGSIPALIAGSSLFSAEGLAGAAGVVIGSGLIAKGFISGAHAIKEDIVLADKFNNARNDDEALKALHDMGETTFEVAESVAQVASGANSVANGIKAVACNESFKIVKNPESLLSKTLGKFLPNKVEDATISIINNPENTVGEHADAMYASGYINGFIRTATESSAITAGIGTSLVAADIEAKFMVDEYPEIFIDNYNPYRHR